MCGEGLEIGCNELGASYDYVGVRKVSSRPQSLDDVYRSSRLRLVRLAVLLVGDRDEAEDIVQSVFVVAASRWDTIDDPPSYLHRAVVNRANDVHRRKSRVAPLLRCRHAHEEGEPVVDDMWRSLQRLPMMQRTVVVLRFYEDLSLTEIALLLERPASTVRSDLRRGLAKLKGLMT
jgi:RNA polymerase sigma factor (sigma-70 family)